MTSVTILGCGWLGKKLGGELVNTGFEVHGSTTDFSNTEALASLGIVPHVLQFTPDFNGDAGIFFKSDVMIISVPPRLKGDGDIRYLDVVTEIRGKIISNKIAKVIFISTTAVYPSLDRVMTEKDADPASIHVHAENMMLSVPDSKVTVLRFGGLIGPDRHPGKFLAGKVGVTGGGNKVNLIREEDCVRIIRSIIKKECWGEILNACSDDHPTRKKYYTIAALDKGFEPPKFSEDERSPGKIVSSEKLKSLLSFQFLPLLESEKLML